MAQLREGRVHDTVTLLVDPEADLDIAESNLVSLIEAAHPVKHLSAHHQTRPGDREIVSIPIDRAEEAGVGLIDVAVDVACQPIHAHRDARVLDGTVGVEQLRSDGSDLGACPPTHQFFEPIGSEAFGVIVEEEQEVARRGAHSGVVDRRERHEIHGAQVRAA